jgi:ubiquinone/menaquinone biosynthesis C-methylase UbiE
MGDWRSYDDVAETYERVHAPLFLEIADDLVDLVTVESGARALDVGTGTGVAAQTLADRGASVVGIDPSLGMLRVAKRVRPGVPVVAAEAIDLPFKDATFDVVTGNFVLAHFTKYQTALFDIVRVLRPGGRLAVSSWSDGPDAFQEAYLEQIRAVVPRELLNSAYAGAAPWHEKFRHREAVEEALSRAGLRSVRTEAARYRWTYSLDDYLDGLTVWATGRFVRDMLGDAGWVSFRERLRDAFAERFTDPLNDFREVILAAATREL